MIWAGSLYQSAYLSFFPLGCFPRCRMISVYSVVAYLYEHESDHDLSNDNCSGPQYHFVLLSLLIVSAA